MSVSIYYAIEMRPKDEKWMINRCFKRLKDATKYFNRVQESYPHMKFRLVRLERNLIYKAKDQR